MILIDKFNHYLYPYNRSDDMEKTNTALILQVQEGDEAAFEELYSQLYQRVYYSAYRICKSDDDAKEVAQQTFIQVHHSIKSLKDPNTFDVWLHRIIVSKCYNLFAKRKDMVIDPETSPMLKNETEYREYLIPQSYSRHQSDLDILNQFIDELPEKYRVLLVLTYFHEYSMEEVAAITELPVGTVKSRLYTARSLLKKKIVEYEKRSGVSLNFHEVSPVLIMAAYAAAYEHLPLTIPACPVFKAKGNWLKRWKKSSKLVKGTAISFSTAFTLATAGWIYTQFADDDPLQDSQTNYQYLENERVFQPVTVDDITYTTPYDAYYSLRLFAHCEIEMEKMSKEELAHFKPLYDALKASNSSYYRRLQDIGWEDAYLNRLSAIDTGK